MKAIEGKDVHPQGHTAGSNFTWVFALDTAFRWVDINLVFG